MFEPNRFQHSQISDPLGGNCPVSSTRTAYKQSKLPYCEQCVRVDVALMEAKTKLSRLYKKMERRTRKRRTKQRRSSQLIPEEIADSSKNNQNYIPQKAPLNAKVLKSFTSGFTAFEMTSENCMRLSLIHFFNIFDCRPLKVIVMPRVTLNTRIRQVNKLQEWMWMSEIIPM